MDSHGIVKPDAHEAFSVDTGGVDQHVDWRWVEELEAFVRCNTKVLTN